MLHIARQDWRKLARRGLDLILPPRCLACGAEVVAEGALCAGCYAGLTVIGAPHCDCCGRPFELDAGAAALCGACLAAPQPYRRLRALWAYDGTARDLVLRLKHADDTRQALTLGRWLARIAAPLVEADTLVAPVPLHRLRLLRRRYNQSALLAQALAPALNLPAVPLLLERTRRTPSQAGLSADGRARNLAGAIRVRPGAQARLDGRGVLLVDDVYTTGATVRACTGALLRGGAAWVAVVVLARVLRADAV